MCTDDDRASVATHGDRAAKAVAGRAVGCSQLACPRRRCPPTGRPGEHVDGARAAPVARGSDCDRASVATHGDRAAKAVERRAVGRRQLGGLHPPVHALGKHVGGPGLLPGVAVAQRSNHECASVRARRRRYSKLVARVRVRGRQRACHRDHWWRRKMREPVAPHVVGRFQPSPLDLRTWECLILQIPCYICGAIIRKPLADYRGHPSDVWR